MPTTDPPKPERLTTGPDRAWPTAADSDRLRRLAFLMLAPALGRRRRAALAQEALGAALSQASELPAVRTALVVQVLRAGNGRTAIPTLFRLPRPSRQVGHPVGETEHHLGSMVPAARAAYLLTHLEKLSADETKAVLRAAGVADPETALSLAFKSPLEPSLVAEVTPPAPRRFAPRLAAAAVGVVVLGIAAPVIAVTTGGGDKSPAVPTSVEQPAAPVDPAAAKAAAAVADDTAQKLARLLGRLEQRLADHEGTKADKAKLKMLRDAMAAQLEQLNAVARTKDPGTPVAGNK